MQSYRKKKVGIVTLHYIPNFGSVLQSYALQHRMEEEFDVEILDYRKMDREWRFSKDNSIKYTFDNKNFGEILKLPFRMHNNRFLYRFREKLIPFYEEKYKLSHRVYKKDLSEYTKKYDAMIVGSDQIWNPKVVNNDYSCMLDFYEGKKFSYASSIGVMSITKEKKEYKKWLGKFDKLSCREKQGAELINGILGDNICQAVLDPIFLLSKQEWKDFSEKPDWINEEDEYVFIYLVKNDDTLLKRALKYAKNIGKKPVLVSSPAIYSASQLVRNSGGRYYMNPEEWVWLVDHSFMIFTNSFHGIAFSINLNKNFWTGYSSENDVNRTNIRIENILSIFELESRKLPYEPAEDILCNTIDLGKVNMILEREKKQCLKYLDEIKEHVGL